MLLLKANANSPCASSGSRAREGWRKAALPTFPCSSPPSSSSSDVVLFLCLSRKETERDEEEEEEEEEEQELDRRRKRTRRTSRVGSGRWGRRIALPCVCLWECWHMSVFPLQ